VNRHALKPEDRSNLADLLRALQGGGADTAIEVIVRQGADQHALPAAMVPAILELASGLASGSEVSVVESETEISPKQASALLGISRPMLMQRVKAGHVPHRMVGTHHRLRLADIVAYQATLSNQRDALDMVSGHTERLR
jgi:excisionase family DNA binding protein